MATIKIRGLLLGFFIFLLHPVYSSGFIISKEQYKLLQTELARYQQIAQNGGWGKITLNKKYYMRGESAQVIAQIKNRLSLTGDYTTTDKSPFFSDELAEAVKAVRKRFGLPVIGSVDAPLVKALNIPVEKRMAQLRANLSRLAGLKISTTGTQLVANIPEFKLHVIEDGQEAFNMDIVVGKASTKTVSFNDVMTHVVFSPYWNVPASIVASEILPAARRNKNYLRNNGYEIVGREGGMPAIRQKPGAGNSLGKVKFVFPNSHNIYFHDTPAKSLFKMDQRAFSHGCIRLAEPAKLAEYLLRNDASWPPSKIRQAMDSGREKHVKLSTPVAVAIVYITAWVDDDGSLNFRDDIYGMDK